MAEQLYVGTLGPTIFTNQRGIVQATSGGLITVATTGVAPADVPALLAAEAR
jgi:hypothetical protein